MSFSQVSGAALAGALDSLRPESVIDPNECLDLVLDWDRVISWATAARAAQLARFGAINQETFAGCTEQEYALGARVSVGQAGYDLDEAALLDGALRPVRDRLSAGEISLRHVRVMCTGLRPLLAAGAPLHKGVDPAEAAQILAERISAYATTHTPAETRVRLRRWLITADIESAEYRHTSAMKALDVTHDLGEDGVGYLTLVGRIEQTTRIWRSLDSAARADAAADHGDDATKPRLGQRRAELMTDLLIDACSPSVPGRPQLSFATEVPVGSTGLPGDDVRFRTLVAVPPEPAYHPSMDRDAVQLIYGERAVRGADPDEPPPPDPRGDEPDLRYYDFPADLDPPDPADFDINEPVPPPEEGPPAPTPEEWLEWLDRAYPDGVPDPDGIILNPTRSSARGRFTRHGSRPYQVNVTVDLPTLLGVADNPALLDGSIPITSTHARVLFGDADFTRFLVDSVSGELLELGAKTYRPSDDLSLFLRARDPICRTPGCQTPAQRCQLDHEMSFNHECPDDGGSTVAENMGPLCLPDHQRKTHGGYSLARTVDGTLELATPLGRRYLCEPYDHRTSGYSESPAISA